MILITLEVFFYAIESFRERIKVFPHAIDAIF